MNYFHTVNIDCNSDNATVSYSECHKHFFFENVVIPPDDYHLVIGLTNFIMPYSFYQIREGINDTFTIQTRFSLSLQYSATITIPEGNYNVKTFTYLLSELLTDAQSSLNCLFQCFFNASNNKLYFTCSENDITIYFTFNNNLNQIMGFNSKSNLYYNVSTFYAPFSYNFSGCTCLYIRMYNMGIKNLNSSSLSDIISCINIECNLGGIIYYNPNQIEYCRINRNTLNDIEIEVLDDNYTPITKLNTRFRFTLSVHYEKNEKSDRNFLSNNITYNNNDEASIENV